MYLAESYDQQLGGFGKKLKKLGRKLGKVVKKVGKVAAIGAGLYFAPAAVASIARSRSARKAAQKQQAAQMQIAREQIASQERIATGMVAQPASPMTMSPSIAPPASVVQSMMPTPTYTLAPQSFAPGEPSPAYEPVPSGGKPAWMVPAAIGGVGLLAVMMLSKRQ